MHNLMKEKVNITKGKNDIAKYVIIFRADVTRNFAKKAKKMHLIASEKI